MNQPITIKLDRERPYEIKWTKRAEARNASLARPVAFSDIGKRKRSLYAMLAIVWSALVERDHGFESPEDLAEFLSEDEQQIAAIKSVGAMLTQAFPEKKTEKQNASSESGPSTSSNSDLPPASTPGV